MLNVVYHAIRIIRILLTIVLALVILGDLQAQSASVNLVLTKEQNDKWISEFSNETKPKQLYLLKERLLADTNVYISEVFGDRILLYNGKDARKIEAKVEGYGKPLLTINSEYVVYFGNTTIGKSVINLTEILTDSNIKDISTMTGSQAMAIYGSRAACGVILLTTKDKRTFKQIKEIKINAY